ncbi:MAG: NAD(P)-dependent oxidoreductase [Acidobacteria bacterium]|nr:NAD(P)-dependent oxidoreductase [Acidobacteriota bacterium]
MKIVLSGATGFLGSALRGHWQSAGHTVKDTGAYRLGKTVPPGLFDGAALFVHAAHAFGVGQKHCNFDGSRALIDSARAAGVKRMLFIGSLSAHTEARSEYGSTKFMIERLFLDEGFNVIRPGLVAGPGGLFNRLACDLRKWRIAPLVDPRIRDVAVIALHDFLAAVNAIVESNQLGAWNLFAPELLTPAEFARAVWRAEGVIVPIPGRLAEIGLAAIGATAMLDSVLGRRYPCTPPHRSDLSTLVLRWTPAIEAVTEAAR